MVKFFTVYYDDKSHLLYMVLSEEKNSSNFLHKYHEFKMCMKNKMRMF